MSRNKRLKQLQAKVLNILEDSKILRTTEELDDLKNCISQAFNKFIDHQHFLQLKREEKEEKK